MSPDGGSRDGGVLPIPDFQTKVPLYGRDHINSRKVQAMKQAKDRKKQLARLGAGGLDLAPLGLDKLEPDFVSEIKERPGIKGSGGVANAGVFAGALQEEAGQPPPEHEGHVPGPGPVPLHPQLRQEGLLQAPAGEDTPPSSPPAIALF